MMDHAAMAVDGGNANGEAHVAHAVAGDGPDVERSTVPEMLRQFRLSGMFCAHVGPTEVIDRVPVITDQGLYDICIRNRACAHTRRLHARYEALPGFVAVLAEPGVPSHAGDRVAEVHGDPFFGNQGPKRLYIRIHVVLQRSHSVPSALAPKSPLGVHQRFVVPREGDPDFRGGGQLVLLLVAKLDEGRLPRELGGHGPRGSDRPRCRFGRVPGSAYARGGGGERRGR